MYFPFDSIRPSQQQLANDISDAIRNKRNILAHAPTGLGKTAAALSPVITAAMENGLTIFFLTPKHTQHQIAIETLRAIKQKHNLSFQAADLIGKKWMCSHPAVENLASKEFQQFCKSLVAEEQCPFYNAVWGKGSDKLQAKAAVALAEIKHSKILHAEELVQQYKDEYCTYELATLLGKEATVVIADYYHIFHPSVRQAFLGRLRKELKNSIVIVDEAHNLPSRIRSILSEKISQITIKRAAKEAEHWKFDELYATLNYINDALDNLSKELLSKGKEAEIKKERFVGEVENATGKKYSDIIDNLEGAAVEIRKTERKSHIGSVADFLEAWLGEDVGFVRILKKQHFKSGNAFASIIYSCLNPAAASAEVFDNCAAGILMSGTLVPGELYRDLLGLRPEKTDIKIYPSPFEAKNRLVLIEPSTTTKFTKRDAGEFEKIAGLCISIIKEVPNNAAVFFPSYFMMQSILPFVEGKLSKQIFYDKSDFTKQQRAEVLKNFKQAADNGGGVLFAVQGGSMSEGVDLPGKFLECVIVVGVPLATPDLETQSLIDYYDYKFGKGWDYGYIFPAMTKALQAAGRCIRTLDDRGAVVFLDNRYSWANYLKCIPPDWKPVVTKLAADRVKRFFHS